MQQDPKTPYAARSVLWTRGVAALIGMLGVIFAAAVMRGPM